MFRGARIPNHHPYRFGVFRAGERISFDVPPGATFLRIYAARITTGSVTDVLEVSSPATLAPFAEPPHIVYP